LEEKFVHFLQLRGQELTSEWYIPDIITNMLKNGETQVKVLNSSSQWFGITYPEDRSAVVAALQSMHDDGIYPPQL
jgi:hypothetical protein